MLVLYSSLLCHTKPETLVDQVAHRQEFSMQLPPIGTDAVIGNTLDLESLSPNMWPNSNSTDVFSSHSNCCWVCHSWYWLLYCHPARLAEFASVFTCFLADLWIGGDTACHVCSTHSDYLDYRTDKLWLNHGSISVIIEKLEKGVQIQ